MFKKSSKKKGAIRKRKLSEDEEQKDDEVDQDEMEKLKLAKLKRELLTKKAGVSAVALAKGKKISKKAELTDDPFKLKSGKSKVYLTLSRVHSLWHHFYGSRIFLGTLEFYITHMI